MWKYNNRRFSESLIKDNVGFVYMIRNKDTGKIYIGQKIFNFTNKRKISKREKTETATKKRFKYVTSDSGWKDYWGSSKSLLEDIQKFGYEPFTRNILKLCKTKKQMRYWEMKYQFIHEVIETDSYNDSINGVFFRRDIF